MEGILLTQDQGAILGPIAKLLGVIINWIYELLNLIGIPNVGLSIILFTIIIYFFMLPLTFKQQKFSKLSAIMNPEIRAVQEKYKGKKDNESMARQNEELQTVYKKYGVSPMGSCLQLLIQMPILFALYRVIYNIPAYVDKLSGLLKPMAEQIINTAGSVEFIGELNAAKQFSGADFTNVNSVIDVLNRVSTAELQSIIDFVHPAADILEQIKKFESVNSFFGINIINSPSYSLSQGFGNGDVLLIIAAIAIPLLAALTQWLNVLFMPQVAGSDDPNNSMASSMKTMNLVMPIMSAVFCYTLPAGLGIYWIASAVVRCIQQICINKYFDKKGLDEIIAKNIEKAAKKEEKKKAVTAEVLKNSASIKTRNFDSIKNIPSVNSNSAPKAGSLAEKANLVKKYNESEK